MSLIPREIERRHFSHMDDYLYADASGTTAAGAVGCIGDGFQQQHNLFRDLWLDEMGRAVPGTLYAEIALTVENDLANAGAPPEYVNQIGVEGGILRYPGCHFSGSFPSLTGVFLTIIPH